jgi:cell division protein FtsN
METMKTMQYQIMIKVFMVLPFYLFTFLPLSAQTFTERIQKETSGQGRVVIHQSDSISKLVNSEMLGNKGTKQPATPNNTAPATPTSRPSSTSPTSTTSATSPSSATSPATPQGEEGEAAPTRIMKTMGYRVQAFAGGNSRADRQRAEATRNNIKAHFPNVPVYVHFFSPRWICRVGNYRTYEEAHQMLTSLQSLGFDQCTIVKGKISVAY